MGMLTGNEAVKGTTRTTTGKMSGNIAAGKMKLVH
jgi:hypothetical protein